MYNHVTQGIKQTVTVIQCHDSIIQITSSSLVLRRKNSKVINYVSIKQNLSTKAPSELSAQIKSLINTMSTIKLALTLSL